MTTRSFPSALRTAQAPPGMRLYAIGDIHGRADLLHVLSEAIAEDLAANPCRQAVTIFVGDYIDRGLGPNGVLKRLSVGDFPTPIVTLRGNHEEALLRFLDDSAALDDWVTNGALTTLHSYGVDAGQEVALGGASRVRQKFLAHFPSEHRQFVEETRLWAEYGGYFFCHAGVRRSRPLHLQDPYDLMWIREGFLDCSESFGKVVVHGHTPHRDVEDLPNRINLDTRAVSSGVLTAVALEGFERRFIQTW
ncbi:metallophosphoesterase [Methylocystis sp. B8]|uniref:metallophosphoesterase n=1 Tax=Methylocystis sp. B8 TaxID=544938 RepID=UPI0010FDF05C|nr:metallophosphoesterase [Methylocystis sp. B8]TLG74107.1 serine/threonine protein phosphatase [Methylocystis sp. B8]